ncbi:MAG: hypothetical protein PXY39_11575 [archaeon]|nr:hypothetical protein [archaeon]
MAQKVDSTINTAWEIQGLASEGPNSEFKEKLMLFGQFVGDWDILECRYLQTDGTWANQRGELHWRWILDGRALQDVWGTIDEETHNFIPDGTTVRFYNPKIDAWQSTWISPTQEVVKTFIGRQLGNEIVLEGKSTEGCPVKWIFSEITPSSFRWRSEETRDEGKTWVLKEEMRIHRRIR